MCEELFFSLRMRCRWLISKEVVVPMSPSVLGMLPEPSCAVSCSAHCGKSCTLRVH